MVYSDHVKIVKIVKPSVCGYFVFLQESTENILVVVVMLEDSIITG